ncbi:MAG: hypothetical protein RDU76_02820 [Candidatus Edwardsbacteria bacterium]|nr:hypothetical protein [Candidatus Edwardsbacteria bacterium]
MIDKLRLQISSHAVKSAGHKLSLANRFEQDGQPTAQGIALKFDNGTEITYGSLRYDYPGLRLESVRGHLYLTVNPRRFANGGGANVGSLSKEEFIAIMERVQHHLETEAGFTFDLNGAKIVRLDVFTDVATRNPFMHYKPALEDLTLSRLSKVVYETGVQYSNSQFAMVIYDKLAELRSKQYGTFGLGDNLMRWELRYLTSLSVSKRLGFDTYALLIEHWQDVKDIFTRQIQDSLNAHHYTENTVGVANILDDLKAITAVSGEKDSFNELIKFYGIHKLVSLAGNLKSLEQVLIDHGFDAKARWRYRKFINLRLSAMVQNQDITYNEIREELIQYFPE